MNERTIGLIGLLLAVITLIVSVTIPEVRSAIGLDRSTPTVAFIATYENPTAKPTSLSKVIDTSTPRIKVLSPTATFTSIPETLTPTTSPTQTPTTIPTSTPLPEIVQSNHNGISIELYNSGSQKENFSLTVLAAGEPLPAQQFLGLGGSLSGQQIDFYPAVKDITGKWIPDLSKRIYLEASDRNGELGKLDINSNLKGRLLPGIYAMTPDYQGNTMRGTWGTEQAKDNDMIVFPIYEGKITQIDISLGILEVGILKPNGDVRPSSNVFVTCQGNDITGKPISLYNKCPNLQSTVFTTDQTGLVRIILGEGIYVLEIYNVKYTYNVHVKAGAIHRELLTLYE